MLGLISISNSFLPIFLGDGFEKSIILLKILSPLVIILGFSNVFGLQYLIPSGKDKSFTIAITVGAIINLILNVPLILLWKSIGAAIASIVAETIVTTVMALMVRKDINILKEIVNGWKYFLSGVIMFALCFFANMIPVKQVFGIIITISVGVISYFMVLFVLREQLFLSFLKGIFNHKKDNQNGCMGNNKWTMNLFENSKRVFYLRLLIVWVGWYRATNTLVEFKTNRFLGEII